MFDVIAVDQWEVRFTQLLIVALYGWHTGIAAALGVLVSDGAGGIVHATVFHVTTSVSRLSKAWLV